MILSVNNIDKTFVDNHLLKNVSFHLNEYDKTALVGINGSGKTTLIRIIMGELNPDNGIVTLSKGSSLGYLPQNAIIDSDNSIYEEVLTVKADLLKDEQVLRDMEANMGSYSGAELDEYINKYHELQHAFELNGGYQIQSEVSGTLKGAWF